MDIIVRSYIPLLANVGVLTLLAWGLIVLGPSAHALLVRSNWRVSVFVGLACGLAAAALMNIPIEIEPGIFGDGRGVPIFFAGLIGGPIGAAIAGAMAAAMRAYFAGAGAASGYIYIALFSISGWLCHRYMVRPHAALPKILDIVLVVTVATALSTLSIFTFPEEKRFAVLIGLWPQMWMHNLVGTLMLGSMVQLEFSRRDSEMERVKEHARANQAAEHKTRFLAAMSHEIRTPLNGILGILQLLERQKLPDDAATKVSTARESGFFLLSLLNQVLDFAKIESGAVDVEAKPFSVSKMVAELGRMFQHQAELKGLDFVVSPPKSEHDVVVGDRDLTRQIVFNLVGNAFKFTDAGSVVLSCRIEPRSNERVFLVIEVSDTGPGISEEDRERIFEEFVQGDTGRLSGGGSGLGLSICRRITDAIDGSLKVRSEVGKGTTFELSLTLPAGDLAISEASRVELISKQPLNLLVAEDNAVNQMIIRSMLESEGHIVTIVENGREAVSTVKNNTESYDAILMDIQMPVLDGLAATREIRDFVPDGNALPIIALTANAFREQQEAYLAAGMQATITKPVELDTLLDCLAATCGSNSRFAVELAAGGKASADEALMRSNSLDWTRIDAIAMALSHENVLAMCGLLNTRIREVFGTRHSGDGDPTAILAHSHEIKGMLQNFGLIWAAQLVETLEHKADDRNEVQRLSDAVLNEVKDGLVQIERYLKSQSADKAPAVTSLYQEARDPEKG